MKWHLLRAAAAVGLLGCSGDGGSTDPGDSGGTGPTVAVGNNAFSPSSIQVTANRTVTWQWNSAGVEHNITFQTTPNSGNRTSGSFSRTFTAVGSFPYACTIHGAEGMTGVVNVTAGGGGGGDGGDGGGGGGYP